MADDKQHKSTVLLTANAKEIVRRFDELIQLMVHKSDLLEQPYASMLLHNVSLTDTEIMNLAIELSNRFRNASTVMRPLEIQRKLELATNHADVWEGRTYIGESDGQIFVQLKKEKSFISNFVLTPTYTISVDKGNKYHVYDVNIKNDYHKYELMLTSDDFNKLDNLQRQAKIQLSNTSAYINGCGQYMRDLAYKYLDLSKWETQKQGTSLIGLERLEATGPKYFCTPHAIYNINGEVSQDIVYMGNEHSNVEEVKKLSNLHFEGNSWERVAKEFLSHVMLLNAKEAMLAILGWIGAIPHDYVIRKEAGTNFFPHCQIVAEPGAGKSTLVQLLKQFMGHNDAAPRVFPSPAETQKLLNSSYTIPAILDEYGKRWSEERTKAIDGILVESFTKAAYSKGRADQSSVYYKYKNPVLLMGQIGPKDSALATRIVPVYLYKSFHNSKKGQKSFEAINHLNKMPDKNFWVGYNLWCAKFTNQEVEDQYELFRKLTRARTKDSRVADIQAIVMLGLYYIRQLAIELGLDESALHFTLEDIHHIPETLNSMSSATETNDVSVLSDFLNSLASFGVSHGNSQTYGVNFGRGYNVMLYKPSNDGAGKYGNRDIKEACIHGRDTIAIKVPEMVDVLNRLQRKDKFDAKEIMTFIESAFREAIDNDGKGLVLAPKQYKIYKCGYYTLFDKEALMDLVPQFENISL